MRFKTIQALLCLFMLNPSSGFTSSQPATENVIYPMDKFSINAAIGYLGGESSEYVYDNTGRKISELNWKVEGAAILKGEINADLSPWLTANVNGWSTMGNNNAMMDDYDWLNPAQSGWTDWSHHSDTDLNYANNIDLNMRGWFLQNPNYKLGAIAGYQQNVFDFLAKGGCYQYDNGLYTGCFTENKAVNGYQQTFETVYVGLAGKYLVNNIEFNATLKVSPWVNASDIDQHYLRNITFTESGDNSSFASATIAAGYHVNQYAKLFFEAAYNNFINGKADTVLDNNRGDIFLIDNGAGLSNNNFVLALGLQYNP